MTLAINQQMNKEETPWFIKFIVIFESVAFIIAVFGGIIGFITGFYTIGIIGVYMIIAGLILFAILHIFSGLSD